MFHIFHIFSSHDNYPPLVSSVKWSTLIGEFILTI
uniref:Uncharacterized protein n=1 Tax=Anguilla anguilla TaxID=7936 RepID=A0A0E9VFY1_ANGAN